MDAPNTSPQLSLQPFDPEVFQRVWQRVMPDQSHSPIVVEPPLPAAVPALSPVPKNTPQHPECLGEGSLSWAQTLQALMDETQSLSWALQRFSRRYPGRASRVFSGLSARLSREGRRLSAAYFLITGERYAPRQSAAPLNGPLDQGVRALFQLFRRRAAQLQGTSQMVEDPCLKQLLQELEDQAEASARQLRSLLEELS